MQDYIKTKVYKNNFLLLLLCLLLAFSSIYFIHKMLTPDSKNIVLITLPKSASDYIVSTLINSTGYSKASIFKNRAEKIVDYQNFFSTRDVISKQHTSVSNMKLKEFRKYSKRLIVHFRDLRSVVLSYVHHIDKYRYTDKAKPVPEEFHLWTLSERIDWCIEEVLPQMCAWSITWLDYIDSENKKSDGIQILVTTYEEMINNEKLFFKRIGEHYDMDPNTFSYTPQQKEANIHFRKGDPNEWRSVFSKVQQERIMEIIPNNLAERFSWGV